MSWVSFSKIRGTTPGSMKRAILDSLNLIGYCLPKEVNSVVIKPNLCYYWDSSTGQTTDPEFVGAIVDLIREKLSPEIDVAIVESDASAMKCKYAFRMLGYEKLSQIRKVRLVNLSEDENQIRSVTCGGQTYKFSIPKTIRNADLKINVPKIKYTGREVKLTCAMKNIFGCNPYPKKFQYHPQLGNVIVALNKAMDFDLCIIDGNIVSGIQPRKMGLVMASQDPVAIDVAAAEIAGVNPKTIKYLQQAKKEGLGNTAFVSKGEPIDYFKARYPRKNVKNKVISKGLAIITKLGLSKRIGLA
jgi:uncharacterized protein (DUF362 family)